MSWKVILDENGNHQSFFPRREGLQEVPNYEFEDTLEYVRYYRGRSAVHVEWKSVTNGKTYESGIKMIDEIMKRGVVYRGRVAGRFTFKKHGNTIHLHLAE